MSAAKLLFALGLRRHPTIDVLLQLASTTTSFPSIRAGSLEYLFSHFQEFYHLTYPASESRKLAFLPSIKPDGSAFLASPLEVFLNPDCAVLGFSVVSSGVRDLARDKLKVAADPPGFVLVEALIKSPSTDVEKAKQAFEVCMVIALLPFSGSSRLRASAAEK